MKLIYTIIKILLLILFLVLAVSNTQTVSFAYLPGQNINLPLIAVLFGAFVIGIVFGMFALFGRLLSLRSENGRLKSEIKKAEKAAAHEAQSAAAAAPAPQAVETQPEAANKEH